mgnify:CR=1 FL=1
MPDLSIPWRPRVIMPGRSFRLPVTTEGNEIGLDTSDFKLIDSRWDGRDSTRYFYLRSPSTPGDYKVMVGCGKKVVSTVIQVRTLNDLRQPHTYHGAVWPRRWPLGKGWDSTKRAQTLQDIPLRITASDEQVDWWISQSDETIWGQLPFPEWPQAHFVNVNQGCPNCGTAVFQYGGFYPWLRNHFPSDFRSTCPACSTYYPSNDFLNEDFTGGETPDDGFGYFDEDGYIYLFTATYHRDQVGRFDHQMQQLTGVLRSTPFDETVARKLTIMLLRYATDILYLAAVPQFRYGPSLGAEEPWAWGQPDWSDEADPIEALKAKGMRRYSIDIPYISETLALAYDTVWPFIRQDREIVDRAQALGLQVNTSEEIILLLEEMLAAQLQCTMDRGARSNLPRESMGALAVVRALDRPDAQDVMDWLYDEGPDRLRVFGTNNFFPDGSPPESTGNYNGIHTNGLFTLEYHLRQLRKRHPHAYSEGKYPSLVDDPRAARVARQPHEVTMIGKSWFQFGDGSAPGSKAQLGQADGQTYSLLLQEILIHSHIAPDTIKRAIEYTDDPVVKEIYAAEKSNQPRHIGTTIHDGVGIGILRTNDTPERAALGIVYGDTSNHRHMDLLDVQLFAHGRPFLTDLGYPQSWATIKKWEGNWATHNTVWSVIPGVAPEMIAGRGRLVRTLFTEGIQVLELAAERWIADAESRQWKKPGVSYRRLIALVETEDDGVAVIDFSRIQGGREHWRVCRGLQGCFSTDDLTFTPQSGTVDSVQGNRGNLSSLAYPDYDGLASMDEVALAAAKSAWQGDWQSSVEPEVYLDLHQVSASDETDVLTARATALMGTPEQSDYNFRTLLWRRKVQEPDKPTHVDLVMEPRIGEANLTEVRSVKVIQGAASGAGVTLKTRGGKHITLYWSPEEPGDQDTVFDDGTVMQGPLAVVVDHKVATTGVKTFRYRDHVYSSAGPVEGRIIGLNRDQKTIDVDRLPNIKPGDRIRINPGGRAHNYEIEAVEGLGEGRLRLTLDVTSLIGRSPIESVEGQRIELTMHIMTRTGNLEQTRLQLEANGVWASIEKAYNTMTGRGSTSIQVDDISKLGDLKPGRWVQVVDYVIGDRVVFEPSVGA